MLTIIIIEALPTILSGWDERLVEKVNEVLLKKEIRTSSAVIRVENDSGTSCSNIYLSNSESQIPSSLTVWTTGVKGMRYNESRS
jgi:NADH dehydrogenase FAD-containing subunit